MCGKAIMNLESISKSTSNRLRPETVSTRLSPSEMRAVDGAVGAAGTTRSTWLREAVLSHLSQPEPTHPLSLESTILEEIMALRYLVINFFSMANLGISLQTLHGAMAIADKGKHGAAVRALDSPGENPTP
jgi:hypothetical protein